MATTIVQLTQDQVSSLQKLIKRKFFTQKYFCEVIGENEATLSRQLQTRRIEADHLFKYSLKLGLIFQSPMINAERNLISFLEMYFENLTPEGEIFYQALKTGKFI